MKQTYSTPAISGASYEDMLDTLSVGFLMLQSVANASVQIIEREGTTLTAIVHAGGDQYFRISASWNGAYYREQIYFSTGAMSGGEFVSGRSVGVDNFREVDGRPTYCELVAINQSFWDFCFHAPNGYDSGVTETEIHLRFAKLTSSFNNNSTIYYTGGVYTGDPFNSPFPTVDYFNIGSNVLKLYYSYQDYVDMNVDDGFIILFPTIFSTSGRCPLGVPRIGTQMPYYMKKNGYGCYMTFYVDEELYICLGRIAVRST